MSARTVLLAAADEIARVGWFNGGYLNYQWSTRDEGLGVLAAIQQSAPVWSDGEDAVGAVRAYLRRHPELANGETVDLHAWNHGCPDEATAVAVLRGAAEMAGSR